MRTAAGDAEREESNAALSDRWLLDEEGLVRWGEEIGRKVLPPVVIALRGDLGAGKTTLARGIARGAGVGGSIPSPTYNLVFRYPGGSGNEVVHLDLFRLEDPEEIWMLGWGELPAANEIVLVEWPERAGSAMPSPRWEIRLGEAEDPGVREVSLVRVGEPPYLPRPAETG